MGGNYSSIVNNDTQKISTTIAQISNEECLNTCLTGDNKLNITIIGTTFNGNIDYVEACYINGASCVLKSTVSNTLINNQTSKQQGNIKNEEDPFDFLNELIPSSDNINQSNFQSVSDNVSQMINSTCQNSTDVSDNDLNITLEDDTVNGNINLTLRGSSTNSKCVINNMTKNYVDNSQYSSQVASIVRESCLAGLGAFLGIILLLIIVKALFSGLHSDKPKSPTPKTTPNGTPIPPGGTPKTTPNGTPIPPSGPPKTTPNGTPIPPRGTSKIKPAGTSKIKPAGTSKTTATRNNPIFTKKSSPVKGEPTASMLKPKKN